MITSYQYQINLARDAVGRAIAAAEDAQGYLAELLDVPNKDVATRADIRFGDLDRIIIRLNTENKWLGDLLTRCTKR